MGVLVGLNKILGRLTGFWLVCLVFGWIRILESTMPGHLVPNTASLCGGEYLRGISISNLISRNFSRNFLIKLISSNSNRQNI